MNARTIREETALLLNLQHPAAGASAQLQAEPFAGAKAAPPKAASSDGLLRRIAALFAAGFAALRAYPERVRTLQHLRALSDRELADIGLSRGELGRVFDAEFPLERTARERGIEHLQASFRTC